MGEGRCIGVDKSVASTFAGKNFVRNTREIVATATSRGRGNQDDLEKTRIKGRTKQIEYSDEGFFGIRKYLPQRLDATGSHQLFSLDGGNFFFSFTVYAYKFDWPQ